MDGRIAPRNPGLRSMIGGQQDSGHADAETDLCSVHVAAHHLKAPRSSLIIRRAPHRLCVPSFN